MEALPCSFQVESFYWSKVAEGSQNRKNRSQEIGRKVPDLEVSEFRVLPRLQEVILTFRLNC